MRRRAILGRAGGLMAAAAACALLAPAAAPAAPAKPGVTTGAAANVAQSTATLTGRVNPNERETTYFFEYGTTSLYGSSTPPVTIGPANRAQAVAADIAGLAPATRYHYRLVARNARGLTKGGNRTFRTRRQPLGLTLAATPNPVTPGGATTLAGTLSGTGNANRQVVLQANPFPYTQGFQNAGDPHVTNDQGAFSFPLLGITMNTQYRVLLPQNQNVQSPIVSLGVAPIVRAGAKRIRRTRRGAIVRFRGRVTPAHDGTQIAIQRLRRGTWVTINGTVARHTRSGRYSRYSKRLRLRRGGTFRVWAGVNDGDHVPATSRELRVRVRR
jgi:hypothetical protein